MEFHRHFALAWLLLACLTLPGDGAGQGGAAPAPSATLTVAKDTTWTHQDLSVAQDLEVLPPATLRLEGTHLRLGGRLEVRAGARLELAPRDGQATDIGPLDDAPATDTHGPWLWVNGTLAAAGLPRTNIHGLRGTGLNNLYFPGGGLLLAGHADLADVDLHDGNATLVVAPSGSARIRDSSLERMGYMGLGVLGQAALDNVTFRGSGSGLVGFQTCAIEARRIRIDAAREAVLDNGCHLTLEGAVLQGGVTGISAYGAARMDLTDVQILGYSARGLLAQGVPAATGAGPTRPVLRLQQVRLDPLGSAGATVGIDVAGTDLGLRDSIVHGNSGDGIRGKEGGLLTLANATITGNGGHGVAVTAVLLGGDLLQGNHFGGNLQGDVQARVPVVARLLDGQDAVVEGANLAVFGPRGVPVLNATGLFAGTILAALDVYRQAPDGTSHFLGPFTYELRHARLARPVMGTLDLAAPVITAHLPAGEPSGVSLLLAGGGLVAGAAVAWSLWVAGRRQRPEA